MSKQRLIYSTFILFGVLLGMGLCIGQATGKDQHGYILRYRVDAPYHGNTTTFFVGQSPQQQWPQPLTYKEERSEWFASMGDAERRLNTSTTFCIGCVSGASVSGAISKEDFIGLYRAEEIVVSQVKVGSEKKLIQKTEEVEVDKLEWRVKP